VRVRSLGGRGRSKRRIVGLLEAGGFHVLSHGHIMPPFDKVERPLVKRMLDHPFSLIERSPLRVIGVARFIAARRR
jgi:hypothetical protein